MVCGGSAVVSGSEAGIFARRGAFRSFSRGAGFFEIRVPTLGQVDATLGFPTPLPARISGMIKKKTAHTNHSHPSLTHTTSQTLPTYLSSFSVHHATILSVQELAYVSLQLVIIHRHDCWRH